MDPITATASAAGALQLISQVGNSLRSVQKGYDRNSAYFKNQSLIDVTQSARVEPIVMLDADCMNLDYATDIMQAIESMFAGYYLQAVNILSTIGGVSVASKLAPLNPNRKLGFEDYDWRMSMSSYKHRLPTPRNSRAMSLEADTVMTIADKDMQSLRDTSALCVGKLYNVTIVENGQQARVPVAIRLMVTASPSSQLIHLFSFKNSYEMDVGERIHMWRAGELELVNDLILNRDILRKNRKALIKDKTGLYAQLLNREHNNIRAGLMNENPSLATASNIAVFSSDTAAAIEMKVVGKLSNFSVRQKVFEATNLMIMAVVDKGSEIVTFYFDGIQEKTQANIKQLRVANKGGGNDTMDLLKGFIAGSGANI